MNFYHSKSIIVPMRVLLAVDKYYPAVNGVITSVKNLKEALERKGHRSLDF